MKKQIIAILSAAAFTVSAQQYSQSYSNSIALASQINVVVSTNSDTTITYTVTVPSDVDSNFQAAAKLTNETTQFYVQRVLVNGITSLGQQQAKLKMQQLMLQRQQAALQSQLQAVTLQSTNQ